MSYSILITPSAINDISEALEYYNCKVNGLGFKFTDEVENNLTVISQNPHAFAERYKSVRAKLLNKFPYIILYRINIDSNTIEIIRIFNTYLNPYWE